MFIYPMPVIYCLFTNEVTPFWNDFNLQTLKQTVTFLHALSNISTTNQKIIQILKQQDARKLIQNTT